MKTKIVTLFLSISLLFTGCSHKSVHLDNSSSAQTASDLRESSLGEKVVVGTLIAGATALILTTAAVVILLLVPKDPAREKQKK